MCIYYLMEGFTNKFLFVKNDFNFYYKQKYDKH